MKREIMREGEKKTKKDRDKSGIIGTDSKAIQSNTAERSTYYVCCSY